MSYEYNLPHPCDEWEGLKDEKGYGFTRIMPNRRTHGAHRVSYCVAHGLELSDIKGKTVRHKCDNPSCVQPSHLELGTVQDNMKDKVLRGRSARGERIASSVLKAEDVLDIRARYIKGSREHGQRAIAREYGVDQGTIYYIVHRKQWRHI